MAASVVGKGLCTSLLVAEAKGAQMLRSVGRKDVASVLTVTPPAQHQAHADAVTGWTRGACDRPAGE